MKKLSFIILIIYLFSFACEPEEEYSEIPVVKYKDFNFEIESIDGFINQVGFLSFDFIDGNGDIGFYENSDTSIEIEINDIFIYKYTKKNGNYSIADTIKLIMPYFEEGVYRKYLKGEMKVQIYFMDQVNDTIKFDFEIMDRSYNRSNLQSTPELIVPNWN
ncbi:MAG: hypothetical protein GQ564_01820 [Bacteroidales bacterium]|nr:hypothetical protein [Bacteroidales bacterium]